MRLFSLCISWVGCDPPINTYSIARLSREFRDLILNARPT